MSADLLSLVPFAGELVMRLDSVECDEVRGRLEVGGGAVHGAGARCAGRRGRCTWDGRFVVVQTDLVDDERKRVAQVTQTQAVLRQEG